MLSAPSASALRRTIEEKTTLADRLVGRIQHHVDHAQADTSLRARLLEEIAELQADLATQVPSPATVAAKAAR